MTQAASPHGADVVCIASWNVDLVSHVPRPLARGETLLAQNFDIGPGGKGSNAAIACARQGARVALVARVGDDDFGRMGLSLWSGEGIDARHVEIAPGERSGVAQILIYPDGDNSIAVAPGAGAGLGARQVEAARATIAGSKVVMASCEVSLEATLAAFRIARVHGVRTLLNPAPARPLPDELLALTDVLTPNETELLTLAGLEGAGLEEGARALLRRGTGAVIATLGTAGCRLWRGDGASLSVPGWRMEAVVDTVGAGDTFTGSLAAALARGETLEDAMRCANAAAALSVTGRGATGGMPSLAGTRALLGTQRAG
ncbi:ribokinase [Azohydromonas caseinilytica]|uniref:Ribokinase n=1 Tax=Azohydromonas caseinilytica TaxID=2728836 RepID=A0A848FG27_9BURK|nr:ribokinase [Azohydromonas caseinilytica]NML18222.1 ribokinase [Azohydromonas caseinilytica]